MPGPTDNSQSNIAYVDTGAFNATIITGIGAAITAFGGAVVGIVKAAGTNIPQPTFIAVMGLVGVALLALAIVVAADVRARAQVKCATLQQQAAQTQADAAKEQADAARAQTEAAHAASAQANTVEEAVTRTVAAVRALVAGDGGQGVEQRTTEQ
jgi:xanthosine utilization system XapX-like protein